MVESSIFRHAEEHAMKVYEIVRLSSMHFNIGLHNDDLSASHFGSCILGTGSKGEWMHHKAHMNEIKNACTQLPNPGRQALNQSLHSRSWPRSHNRQRSICPCTKLRNKQ